jgi:hypothetical protein
MTTKRKILAVVAGWILLGIGRYLIHALWLIGTYRQNAALWRPESAMPHLAWVVQVANLILAIAAVLIYIRGVEPKPWLGQGVRFGILLALATAVPQSLVEYFTYPISPTLAWQWILGEGALAVLLGVVLAGICRRNPAAQRVAA